VSQLLERLEEAQQIPPFGEKERWVGDQASGGIPQKGGLTRDRGKKEKVSSFFFDWPW